MPGRPPLPRLAIFVGVSACALWLSARACAQGRSLNIGELVRESQSVPASSVDDRLRISADFSQEWRDEGAEYYLLRGNCRVEQGPASVQSGQMVVRRVRASDGEGTPERLSLYLEDDVRFDKAGRTETPQQLFLELSASAAPVFHIAHRLQNSSATYDEFFVRAERRRRDREHPRDVVQTQYTPPLPEPNGAPELRLVQLPPNDAPLRHLRILRRSAETYTFRSERSDATTPPELIMYLTGGIRVLIDGLEAQDQRLGSVGTVDLSADNVIVWREASESDSGDNQLDLFQTQDAPLQVYLEGNIVIRQGNQVINAERAFYDARAQQALIVNAEMRAFLPQLQSDIRLRAESIRMLSPNFFHAQNAWTSTSQYGKPGYRLQAGDIYLENRVMDPWVSGEPTVVDPQTGEAVPQDTYWMKSINNTFLLGDVPLLYTPYVSGPAEDPKWPVRRMTLSQDRIYGTAIRTAWDVPQLFGLQVPDGINWDLMADYYSKRGPFAGTVLDYRGFGLFGRDPVSHGQINVDALSDGGLDNLGRDRRTLVPKQNFRGQFLWRHQQPLPNDMLFQGEIAYLSDRNYLEQFYEKTFDQEKDYETVGYLKQDLSNWGWSALVKPELNAFAATSKWLPKGDLYSLSEPLPNSIFTWSSHSSVGYANIQQGKRPSDPHDLYTVLPWFPNTQGLVAMSRQQIDAPFSLGPLNVVPFAMGEAAFWGEDMTGNSLERLVGQLGARAHLSSSRLYPNVESDLFNLTGLMHKIDWNAEYSYTDATQSFSALPQYNEFEDNAQDRFRRRLVVNTYGGMLPLLPGYAISPVDPRYYIVRTGAASSVTAPYHELVNTLQVLRFNMRHRLQTKVGPPTNMRIADWMTFEAGASFFPRAQRDNFGQDFGLIYGNYEWAISPRTKFLAGGIFDLFQYGQKVWNVGVLTQRSLRGSLYVGLRNIQAGPLKSQILTASYSYVMSPKWISTLNTAYDVAQHQNRGQSMTITRVGEFAFVHFGAGFDWSKGNANFTISVEPKFGNQTSSRSPTKLGSLLKN